MKNVTVRFINVATDQLTEVLGPFDYVQMTYDALRVAPPGKPDKDTVLAHFDCTLELWYYSGEFYTDVTICADQGA